jgi:hypothetical protein
MSRRPPNDPPDGVAVPRYVAAVLAHLSRIPPANGRVIIVEVRHDGDCGIFAGCDCDCSPLVASRSA